ncbi:MAG TPA: hypothetical protein VIU38_02575 [Anaerolineales bacterium]
MAKVDGVIEAVRYKGGKIDLVRLYERRGPTYGDHVVMDRLTLLSRLKEGKRIMTGQRKPYLASTFDLGKAVALVGKNGNQVVTTSDQPGQDRLEGVPAF